MENPSLNSRPLSRLRSIGSSEISAVRVDGGHSKALFGGVILFPPFLLPFLIGRPLVTSRIGMRVHVHHPLSIRHLVDRLYLSVLCLITVDILILLEHYAL